MTDGERPRNVSFEVGDIQPAEGYRIVHPDGTIDPDGPAKPLGGGGAGTVFRATFKELMDRAVKVLDPQHRLDDDDALAKMQKTFQLEVALLSRLTHRHIAKITDIGLFDSSSWWYAMDFIDGDELTAEYWAATPLEARRFLRLIDQILDAVEYLHGAGVMHSDLKGKNILVSRDGTCQATVLDLGVAKVVKQPLMDELLQSEESDTESGAGDVPVEPPATWEEDDFTLFFSSKSITREVWLGYLDRRISRRKLAEELFPAHDLYGLGVLLRDALNVPAQREQLEHGLGPDGLSAMERVRDRLLMKDPEEQYESAAQLRRDWGKLDPGYLAPLQIDELAVGATAATSIATPTGRVSLSHRMLAVLNHPAMQRLRHIPQLEFVSLVFPGATHTRLLHSLTSFDTTRRYLLHLLRDPSFRLMVDDYDVEATLLWGLTHDIGHYPLSHMFEDFATEQVDAGGPVTIPTDEDLFWAFALPERTTSHFRDYATFIQKDVRRATSARGRSFAEMLAHKNLFAPEVFERLVRIGEPRELRYRLLAGVLSSSIDVDKVSYLTDDSVMTGVRFGHGLDIDGLLAALRTPESSDVPAGTSPVVAITDKGLPGAESVILARYWMLKRVYWHHTNRAMIAMVKSVISQLSDAGRLDMGEYLRENLFSDAPQALRWLSDRFEQVVGEGKLGDPPPRNPLSGILGGERQIYKRLISVAKGREERLYGRLSFKRAAELRGVVETVEAVIREHLDDPDIMRPGDVIIDVPSVHRELSATPVLVYPQDPSQEVSDLLSASPVSEALRQEFDAHVKKCRIMLHPELAQAVRGKQADVREQVRRALEQS
jgi:HD superfamily phosphohydrolase